MALGNFNNYLCFNLLSSLMGNSGQPIVVRLWVQGADNHQIAAPFRFSRGKVSGIVVIMGYI